MIYESISLLSCRLDFTFVGWSDIWRKSKFEITNGKFSLFCSLYKASFDIAGEYIHRRSAMQIIRFTLKKYENGRVKEHRLMDWNNHPDTTFEEVKKVLKESMEEVKRQLK
jgi:hypothetical protein